MMEGNCEDRAKEKSIQNPSSELPQSPVIMAPEASEDLPKQDLERYILIVSYDGTGYSGFQRQSSSSSSTSNNKSTVTDKRNLKRRRQNNENKKKIKNRNMVPATVQETLEDTLEFYTGLDRLELKARFAGRTDGGVHVSFDFEFCSFLCSAPSLSSSDCSSLIHYLPCTFTNNFTNTGTGPGGCCILATHDRKRIDQQWRQ